jgi:hypothetical protein
MCILRISFARFLLKVSRQSSHLCYALCLCVTRQSILTRLGRQSQCCWECIFAMAVSHSVAENVFLLWASVTLLLRMYFCYAFHYSQCCYQTSSRPTLGFSRRWKVPLPGPNMNYQLSCESHLRVGRTRHWNKCSKSVPKLGPHVTNRLMYWVSVRSNYKMDEVKRNLLLDGVAFYEFHQLLCFVCMYFYPMAGQLLERLLKIVLQCVIR